MSEAAHRLTDSELGALTRAARPPVFPATLPPWRRRGGRRHRDAPSPLGLGIRLQAMTRPPERDARALHGRRIVERACPARSKTWRRNTAQAAIDHH